MIDKKLQMAQRIGALNREIMSIRAFKDNNPELKQVVNHKSPNAILAAYRECDITFDECLDLLRIAFKNQETQ